MDVFWVVHGGGNPIDLFAKYPNRFPSTHLKDLRKGTKVNDPTDNGRRWHHRHRGCAPRRQPTGVTLHFIEDEQPESEKQTPCSLDYLAKLKL
jgi:hypothetical protein